MTITYIAGSVDTAERTDDRPGPVARPVRSKGRRRSVPRGVRKLSGPVLLLAVWAIVCGAGWVSPQVLSSPWQVARAGWHLTVTGQLWSNLSASLERVIEGTILGVALGTALAVAAGLSRLGEDLLDTTMQIFKAVPTFALVPLLIMWFGIDNEPRILLIMLGTSVPIYINTFSAIRNVDRDIVEAAQAFGAGRWLLITQVILPGSLSGFLVGLRFALTGAWLSLVFAETINTNQGLGYLMSQAQTLLETDVMLFTIVVYAVLGLLSYALVRFLERHLLAWRQGFEGVK
jgi:sulfonate transport system permease protein